MDYEFFIKKEESYKRLDVFLTERDGELSRSQWQKKIKSGEVLVNGKEKMVPHYKLKVNDKIQLKTQNSKLKDLTQNLKLKIEVIFESDDYLVLNKPAGMVVTPDAVNKGNTLSDWLLEKYPEVKQIGEDEQRAGIVHRLDKGVSGLLMVARNQRAFNHFKKQFQDRKVLKEYVALVHNQMRQDEGEVKLPIARSKRKGIFVAMTNVLEGLLGGRQAVTRYKVVERFKNFTLVRLKILTGRTHQIRVHLRSIGYPVVGDKLYETHDVRIKNKGIKLGRLWLYAAKMGFKDLNGQWKEFEIEAPKELRELLEQIK
jgi:23S rRNA pseudouridine1911/1915/1917 synthase